MSDEPSDEPKPRVRRIVRRVTVHGSAEPTSVASEAPDTSVGPTPLAPAPSLLAESNPGLAAPTEVGGRSAAASAPFDDGAAASELASAARDPAPDSTVTPSQLTPTIRRPVVVHDSESGRRTIDARAPRRPEHRPQRNRGPRPEGARTQNPRTLRSEARPVDTRAEAVAQARPSREAPKSAVTPPSSPRPPSRPASDTLASATVLAPSAQRRTPAAEPPVRPSTPSVAGAAPGAGAPAQPPSPRARGPHAPKAPSRPPEHKPAPLEPKPASPPQWALAPAPRASGGHHKRKAALTAREALAARARAAEMRARGVAPPRPATPQAPLEVSHLRDPSILEARPGSSEQTSREAARKPKPARAKAPPSKVNAKKKSKRSKVPAPAIERAEPLPVDKPSSWIERLKRFFGFGR